MKDSKPIDTTESPDDVDAFLRQVRTRATAGREAIEHDHKAAVNDMEFLSGKQWTDEAKAGREGRPTLTLNRLPQYLDQIQGDQRQNKISVKLHPVDGAEPTEKIKNVAGTSDYTYTDVLESLISNIEYISSAEDHYDEAFQHAVESGTGWLRVVSDYSRSDTFDQDLLIKHVNDRFAVIPDPAAVEPDKSDMNWCFIFDRMHKDEFDERYPDAAKGDLADQDSWTEDDFVFIAEYFWREAVQRELIQLSDGRVVWLDEIEDVVDELAAAGVTETRRRSVDTWEVNWCLLTANSVLEETTVWPGQMIPVAPVYGKKMQVDGKTHHRGAVRFAKDPQRMHNYWMSAATERVALSPKAPYMAEAEAIEGYESEWETANTENHSVLRYNTGFNAPRREMPPSMPGAELQMAMSMVDEIKATVGMYDASVGAQGNETSGKAILARQREADVGSFVFFDNLNRSIRKIGKILVEAIPHFYDGARVVRIRNEDESVDAVAINQTIKDVQTGEPVVVHDITRGKYDVVAKSGPSYSTRRVEAANSMTEFIRVVPDKAGAMMDLVAKNMDWEGADEIAKRFKKLLPPELKEPEEGEEQAPPTPEQQAAMMAQQQQMQMMQMEQQLKQQQVAADMEKAKAQSATAQAQVAVAQLRLKEQQLQVASEQANSVENIREMVAQTVAEALRPQLGR